MEYPFQFHFWSFLTVAWNRKKQMNLLFISKCKKLKRTFQQSLTHIEKGKKVVNNIMLRN